MDGVELCQLETETYKEQVLTLSVKRCARIIRQRGRRLCKTEPSV